MVNMASTDHGNGLEAAMRMLGKSRHRRAVIHVPAILAVKVLTDVTTRQRAGGAQLRVTLGIAILMPHAGEERIRGRPRKAEGSNTSDHAVGRVGHPLMVRHASPVP